MTIPYYPKLEKRNRVMIFGHVKNDNSQKSELLISLIEGSYLSAAGSLVDCTGGHKGNNFWYSIYYYGVRDLLCDIKGEFLGSFAADNNYQVHIKRVAKLKRYLYELKINDLRNIDILFSEYYNLASDFTEINLEKIRSNLIGLIGGDIEVNTCFKELKEYVADLVNITSYRDKKILGVVIGSEPIIEVTNEFLKDLLKDKNDFLVQMVGFDKIETQMVRTLTTSKQNVNEAFFNYLIMEWQICQIPKFIIDQETRKIIKVIPSDFSISHNSGLEREFDKEIQLVKKFVPLSERSKYFL